MTQTAITGRQVKNADLTDADFASANIDGTTSTPSLRTLGTGAQQAAAGDAVAILAGRAGGQILIGGTAAGDYLTLKSTSNASKGKIVLGNAGTTAYDEGNDRLGIGTASPAVGLHAAVTTTIFGQGEGGAPTTTEIRGAAAAGTNVVGADLYVGGSAGSGSGGGGSIILRTAPADASGSTANTLTSRVTIDNLGRVGIGVAPSAWLHLVGPSAPASVATTPGTAGTSLITSSTSPGGATTIATTGTGGTGGSYSFTGGTGGQAAAAATASTGGTGGQFQFTGGTGGAAAVAGTGTNTGGNGGAYTLAGGDAGAATGSTSGTNAGGTGGGFTIAGGTGGTASGSSTANNAGNGGALTIRGGQGGTSSGTGAGASSGGNLFLRGGAAAAQAGAGPGSVTVIGGAASSTGSGGAGGSVTITGTDAGGDNTGNRQGGLITIGAGASKGGTVGGTVSVTGGAGGPGGGANGAVGGAVTITAGTGGSNATNSGAGGALTIRGGLGGAAGTPGAGGAIILQTASTTTHTTRLTIDKDGQLVHALGTITTALSCLSSTATWNASGVTFTHILANVTDSASAAGSLLLDLQIGSTSKINVRKDGRLSITAGTSSGYARVGGAIFDHFADAGNTTTSETDIYSDTTAANTLASDGGKLIGTYGGTIVGHATATRQIRVYFAGTLILDSTAVTAAANAAWSVNVLIERVSATVVRYLAVFQCSGASTTLVTSVGELTGLTLSATNILKVTGTAAATGAATNDIVGKLSSVRWLPAA